MRNKIVIDADSFEAFCKESGLDKFVTHIMSLPPVFTYNDLSYDLLFKKVHELCSSGKKENSGFAHGYILEILHKAFLSESSYKNKGKDDVIQKILDIISEKDGITNLSEISEILHMNKYYVCHLFKDKTGINLSNYISEKLYERCIRIITHTSMSFEDTALECGFATTSSLTRFVKKKSGKCPKDIRRSSGN